MKKPIDPNLDFLDEELLDSVENEEKPKNEIKTPAPQSDDGVHVSRNIFDLTDDGDKAERAMSIEETPIDENRTEHHHHHHHHHHSSDGEHHSSSGSHHHSSGSHHSSSGSHHHSSGSHHSSSSKSEKKKKSVGSKIVTAIIAILLAILLALVGTLGGLYFHGKKSFEPEGNEGFQDTIEYNGHTYVYNDDVIAFAFLGIDKRELGLVDGKVGTAGQADMCIVGALNRATGEAKVIAVPRDTMAEVDQYTTSGIFAGTNTMQVCLAYAYGDGGEGSARNTMTSLSRILLNVPIEKYFALDLDGIAPLNDAIGGVDINPALYTIEEYGIVEGESVHLEGDMTEAYVRRRSMDSVTASLNRTDRQIQYIKAYAKQLAPAVIRDFGTVTRLYNLAGNYSSTNISLSNATYLGSLLLRKGVTDFEAIKLEGEMKESEVLDEKGTVYAEFYPSEESLYGAVLSAFYTQVD